MFGFFKRLFAKKVIEELGSNQNEDDYIDLGLSVKWARCNIGANSPEDIGDYYNYDEIEGKYNLPTVDQVRELFEKCKIKYDKKKNGFTVSGPNGNSIFIPVGGEREGNAHYEGGYFWTCSDHEEGYMQGYKYYGAIYVVSKALKKIKTETNLLKREGFWINIRPVK